MTRGKSLYSMERECYICHNPICEVHHIYGGVGRRGISDREGCWIYLCRPHHQGNKGVHGNARMMQRLRADCQRRWEEREGVTDHDAFRKVFGESFILDE